MTEVTDVLFSSSEGQRPCMVKHLRKMTHVWCKNVYLQLADYTPADRPAPRCEAASSIAH